MRSSSSRCSGGVCVAHQFCLRLSRRRRSFKPARHGSVRLAGRSGDSRRGKHSEQAMSARSNVLRDIQSTKERFPIGQCTLYTLCKPTLDSDGWVPNNNYGHTLKSFARFSFSRTLISYYFCSSAGVAQFSTYSTFFVFGSCIGK